MKYPTFAQYSSTRTFFRSESRCKRGDHNKDTSSTGSVVKSTTDNHKAGARRVKERKHVRFKAEPQVSVQSVERYHNYVMCPDFEFMLYDLGWKLLI